MVDIYDERKDIIYTRTHHSPLEDYGGVALPFYVLSISSQMREFFSVYYMNIVNNDGLIQEFCNPRTMVKKNFFFFLIKSVFSQVRIIIRKNERCLAAPSGQKIRLFSISINKLMKETFFLVV